VNLDFGDIGRAGFTAPTNEANTARHVHGWTIKLAKPEMREIINKADWLAAGQCPTLGWYRLREQESTPTEAERFRMEQGQNIGVLARALYPDGILISRNTGQTLTEATQGLIAEPKRQTFFEAAFHAAPFAAKVDILRRHGDGWHVLEVKSSFPDSGGIKDLIDDLAYTVFVLRRAGQRIAKASLVLLSRSYRYGDPTDALFETVDKTIDVNERIASFEDGADNLGRVLLDATPPKPRLVPACRECSFFGERCLGTGIAHTIFEIPGLSPKKLKRLSEGDIIDLSRIPDDFELTDHQKRAVQAAISGTMTTDGGLRAALYSLKWPCHYLDFETVATFLPLYPGHGCHEQVLTQFSIHHRKNIDAGPTHSEYLADPARDCQRELAERLIEDLAQQGSILVYSNFEATRIKELQKSFPDLAGRLQAILDRLQDLLPIIDDHVYHPDFRGRSSIKNVLPALVPDLSYADLAVKNGATAITRFARMARGEIKGETAEATRKQLLDYCEKDTLAMVRLHEVLYRLAQRTC
jgi:hypothetical protein